MEISFKEKSKLPLGTVESIKAALTNPLMRFKNKIKEVSVNVKDFNFEKPNMVKSLKVYITLNNGQKFYLEKSNSSLKMASAKMVKAIKDLMSTITNKSPLQKRQRTPIYLMNEG